MTQSPRDTAGAMREAGANWRPIKTAPAPDGYIDNFPSFYTVREATVIRYAHDEGDAVCLIRARLNHDESRWEPFGWLPLPAADDASTIPVALTAERDALALVLAVAEGAFTRINARLSANHTFDELMRDSVWCADECRAILTRIAELKPKDKGE